jgi:hypothetical protein
VFIDVQFLKNENKQIKQLRDLNYNGVFFITDEPKNHRIIDDFFIAYISLKSSKKFLSLGIFDNILDFKNNINKFDLFLLDFRKKEDKMDYRNSLFSPSIAYLPDKYKGLIFPLTFFVNENFEGKARILGRFKQNIEIVKKKKNKFLPIFATLNHFENIEKVEDPRNIQSLVKILGLNTKDTKKSLGYYLFYLYKQKLTEKNAKLYEKDFVIFEDRP